MIELKTYEDVEALYLALGWGCKCCGRLNSASWHQCGGDTYCGGCKRHMQDELGGLKFTEYEHGPRTVEIIPDETGQGFEVAAHQRMEHERIYGFLPSYS